MKAYFLSLAVGTLVGIIYGLLNVRSPAPPVIALLGLLGILVGEQVTAAAKRSLAGQPITMAWLKSDCAQQVLGHRIGRGSSPRIGDQPHEQSTESV